MYGSEKVNVVIVIMLSLVLVREQYRCIMYSNFNMHVYISNTYFPI